MNVSDFLEQFLLQIERFLRLLAVHGCYCLLYVHSLSLQLHRSAHSLLEVTHFALIRLPLVLVIDNLPQILKFQLYVAEHLLNIPLTQILDILNGFVSVAELLVKLRGQFLHFIFDSLDFFKGLLICELHFLFFLIEFFVLLFPLACHIFLDDLELTYYFSPKLGY